MAPRDARVDDYIDRAPPFAQPILVEIRSRVHRACAHAEESMRWGMPASLHEGLLLTMAGFRSHCACSFWKHELLFDSRVGSAGAMGSLGRLTSIDDLPGKREFTRLVRAAVRLNEEGVKVPRTARSPAEDAPHPDFARALTDSAGASRHFASLSPSGRREYTQWIAEAKREDTRARRIAKAIAMLELGEGRNDRYRRRR